MIKYYDQATWEGEGLFSLHFYTTVHHGRNSLSEQSLKPWQYTGGRAFNTGAMEDSSSLSWPLWLTYGLMALMAIMTLMAYSDYFLLAPRVMCPGLAPLAMNLVLPHQTVTKNMFNVLVHSPVSWSHFLHWGHLFSMDSCEYQFVIKCSSTIDPLPM